MIRLVDGPIEYVAPSVPDRNPGTAAELWETFAAAAQYEPKGAGERSAWKKITDQWSKDGFTRTEIRRAVAGFKSAHKGQPIHIWDVNHGISAYIALMTPRDAERLLDEDRSRDVPPPPEVVEMFTRRDPADG